jgi:protein TonB
MKTPVFGMFLSVLFHLGLILFGGLLFLRHGDTRDKTVQVELDSEVTNVAKTETPKDKAKAEAKADKAEKPDDQKDMEADEERPPDAAELLRTLEERAPALDAASLGAIEDALSGNAPVGGEFADVLTFASGGRIGGTGVASADRAEQALALAETDERPRPIFQAMPEYPAEMRRRNLEGLVQVVFIVDETGRVLDARAEKASATAFERPAVDAVRRWRFEPATQGGRRVQCRMRVPIRFQPG